MTQLRSVKAKKAVRAKKAFFYTGSSTAFDQYLQDIQKLPLINVMEAAYVVMKRMERRVKNILANKSVFFIVCVLAIRLFA